MIENSNTEIKAPSSSERVGERLKILVFIDWFLPGYKAGGPIQSCANLIEHLKDEFDFSVVTRDTDYCETIPYSAIKSNEWNNFDGYRVYYISNDKLTHLNIKNILAKEDFDEVYLNGIYSLYFTLIPLYYLRRKHNKQVVIAARGMFSKGALGVKSTKKKFFMTAVRVLKLFHKVVFHATSKDELKDIRKQLGDKVVIKVAGNLPQKQNLAEWKPKQKEKDELRIVNIARISPEKNLKYALEVLKMLKPEPSKKITLDFYGPVYNEQYWNECKDVMKEISPEIKVNYKNALPSDKVFETLQHYHILFMPTTGENFGHIILQAMSAGLPVLISDKTIWKNLDEKNIGWDISLNNKQQFADAILKIACCSNEEYNTYSYAAYNYAKAYINNKDLIEANRGVFR